MEQNQVVDEATTTRALPFVAFAIAYVLVGGAIFSVSNALLRHSSLDDPDVILLSVLLTVGLGWAMASAVARTVERRLRDADGSKLPS